MAVYVDSAIHLWRGRKWCHLFSADLAELHRFAARLMVDRRRFQHPPFASWPHYDITAEQREVAVRLGALAADRRTTVLVSKDAMLAWCRAHRPDLVARATAERARWRAKHPDPSGL